MSGTERGAAKMKPWIWIAAFISLLGALPCRADELRERQLESQVQRLERELAAVSRRVEELERRGAMRSGSVLSPAPVRSAAESPAWLLTANWERIKPGMPVAQVVALLGRPTSTRSDANGKIQTLMYAMELGPEAVLAGSIAVNENGVTAVHRPEMR